MHPLGYCRVSAVTDSISISLGRVGPADFNKTHILLWGGGGGGLSWPVYSVLKCTVKALLRRRLVSTYLGLLWARNGQGLSRWKRPSPGTGSHMFTRSYFSGALSDHSPMGDSRAPLHTMLVTSRQP